MPPSPEIVYFTLVFLVAACSGISRTLRNGDYDGFSRSVGVALVSGFLGLGVVGLTYNHIPIDPDARGVFGIAISSLIGLSGKEQTDYISAINKSILRVLGVNKDDYNKS